MPPLRAVLRMLAIAVVLLHAAVGRAQEPGEERARALFQEGISLGKQGRWLEARESFAQSLALKRSPITLYSLGLAELELKHLVAAHDALRAFLREPPTPTSQRYEEPAREALKELERRVARVTIVVEPPDVGGLAVAIDNNQVNIAELGKPTLVDPGSHVVVGNAPGYQQAQQKLHLGEGDNVDITLRMQPHAEDAPRAERAIAPAPPPPEGFSGDGDPGGDDFPTAAVVLMTIGGVATVVGVAVGLAGYMQARELSTGEGPEAEQARAKAIAGDVLAGAGIVTAVIGLVVLLVDSDDGKSAAKRRPALGFRF